MRYVPTSWPAPTDAVAVRRAVHDLWSAAARQEATHPAWASRFLPRPSWDAPMQASVSVAAGRTQDAASDTTAALLVCLQAVTRRYVCGLRAGGARPEQMLVQVKSLIRDATVADGRLDPRTTRALTEEMVRWSIAAYYDA